MAVVLVAALVSGGALAYVVDARAKRREVVRRAAEKASIADGIRQVCAAIDNNAYRFEVAAANHARRMEQVTDGHGTRLRGDMFTIMANTWRGEALAASDAREAAARSVGNDTGPMQAISGR